MMWPFRRKRRYQDVDPATASGPVIEAEAVAVEDAGADAEAIAAAAPDLGNVGGSWQIEGVAGKRLGYDEAAMRFVAWLQRHGETGEITRPRLKALYARHCEDDGLAWLPENKFFEALRRAGAERYERRVARPDRVRTRVTTYDIPAAAPAARIRSVA